MIKNTIRKCAAILILVSLVGCGQNKGVNNQSKAETTKEETVTKSQIETGENQDVENTQSTTDTSQNEEKSKTTAVKNAKTEKIYKYICSMQGKGIISGQQESTWMGSDQYEFDYIYNNTGKYPAIRGLDYMNDDFEGVNNRAMEWDKKGGIITICWHCGSDFSLGYNECLNTNISNWTDALTEGTAEYDKMIEGMDRAAKALVELKNATGERE